MVPRAPFALSFWAPGTMNSCISSFVQYVFTLPILEESGESESERAMWQPNVWQHHWVACCCCRRDDIEGVSVLSLQPRFDFNPFTMSSLFARDQACFVLRG